MESVRSGVVPGDDQPWRGLLGVVCWSCLLSWESSARRRPGKGLQKSVLWITFFQSSCPCCQHLMTLFEWYSVPAWPCLSGILCVLWHWVVFYACRGPVWYSVHAKALFEWYSVGALALFAWYSAHVMPLLPFTFLFPYFLWKGDRNTKTIQKKNKYQFLLVFVLWCTIL